VGADLGGTGSAVALREVLAGATVVPGSAVRLRFPRPTTQSLINGPGGPRRILVTGTWVRRKGESEWHAVYGLRGGLVTAYCPKYWADTERVETGSHDKNDRCWTCQGRLIEQKRIGIGLAELERGVLWEAEMCDA
jgi:hypothetical protein